MFAIELYINEIFHGYLNGKYVHEITKDINKAFLASTLDEAKEKAICFLDKVDFDEDFVEYKIIELEFKKVREYIPKSTGYFNDEFIVNSPLP